MENKHIKRRYRKTLLSAHSLKNRRNFINKCIDEKVIPKSSHRILHTSTHIFPKYIHDYLRTSADELRQKEILTFEKARHLRSIIHKENLMSNTETNALRRKINHTNHQQNTRLDGKISSLCSTSKWPLLGRQDLINNISNRVLTQTEQEALSFGLKFAIGINKTSITDTVTRNYRYTDTDFNKGFIQGIITSSIDTSDSHYALPTRHINALKDLSRDNNIHITSADKGGGVVVMDTHTYTQKIASLLNDTDTYETTKISHINKETSKFNKSLRSILKDEDPSWTRLIEYHPTLPRLYGLPKTHKPNIPLRPIISGIGSATHKIARAIAKILTPLLGTISPTHIKNSGDLIQKLQDIDMTDKLMASLDVTSLYTNIPVEKCIDKLETHLDNIEAELDLPTDKIIRICTLITNQCYFTYDNKYYKQKLGLPMGSPVSGVLACLFLEFLESGPFSYILPKTTTYFRYIDDALIIYPRQTNLENLVTRLNDVEPTIKFTHEDENDDTLPFLDVRLHRTENKLKFSVFRKITNKDDHIHFYSHHTPKIKSGLIIGFYLRALRICSPEHLTDEERYIEQSFSALQYPRYFILNAKKKAHKIHNTKTAHNNNKVNKTNNIRRIILPTNSTTTTLSENLCKLNIHIATSTSQTIGGLTKKSQKKPSPQSEAGIYSIPCSKCDKCYIGETSRSLKQRLYEHRRDLKLNNHLNSLVGHRNTYDHNFNLQQACIIKNMHDANKRRCLEAALISECNTISQRPGFFHLATALNKLILTEEHIDITRIHTQGIG